jgi:hypothetical protein
MVQEIDEINLCLQQAAGEPQGCVGVSFRVLQFLPPAWIVEGRNASHGSRDHGSDLDARGAFSMTNTTSDHHHYFDLPTASFFAVPGIRL